MKGSGFGLARGPLLNAFLFQVFNTSSFYLIMGLPMMLYFKKLGASATVLGVIAALGALMNIFQIPAARFVERIGYRTFVLRGVDQPKLHDWGSGLGGQPSAASG